MTPRRARCSGRPEDRLRTTSEQAAHGLEAPADMPSVALILALFLSVLGPSAVAEGDACAGLTLPPGIGLRCEPSSGAQAADTIAVIIAEDGRFSDFSRMTLRALDRQRDALA